MYHDVFLIPDSSGTSHRAEWAAFTREIKNKAKFPIALSDHLQRDKNDLFNLWLQNGQNLKTFLGLIGTFCFWLGVDSQPSSWLPFPMRVSHLCPAAPRVEVVLERQIEVVNRVRTGREGKKKRELAEKYSAEKVEKLTQLLRTRGMWYWDPDFVGDEDDSGTKFQNVFYLKLVKPHWDWKPI